jgi:Cu-Zn family superoxide dismutase
MRMIVSVFIAVTAAAALLIAQAAPAQVKAEFKDAKGQMVGQATITETPKGVQIRLTLIGVPEGTHAFHIHATGKCDPPMFTTAGDHFNPEHKQHGRDNPMGRHAGDMPNVTVPASGRLIVEHVEPMVTLKAGAANSLFDTDGAALVIHQAPDDNKTDPAGHAGARIACGVITK